MCISLYYSVSIQRWTACNCQWVWTLTAWKKHTILYWWLIAILMNQLLYFVIGKQNGINLSLLLHDSLLYLWIFYTIFFVIYVSREFSLIENVNTVLIDHEIIMEYLNWTESLLFWFATVDMFFEFSSV